MLSNIARSLAVLSLLFSEAYSQTGTITGSVADSKMGEPLVGATAVVVELKNTGTMTDFNGRFKVVVPVGSYSLRISMVGYQPVVETDIIVRTGSETPVNVKMTEMPLQLDQVTVSPDYFERASIENFVSTVALGSEEIRRSPGSDMDYQRVLQGMPGVSFSTDQTNELLVRGGAPDENLTTLDHMEVQSTNHYPNQYNSGGPINMVNVDLIQDVQFSTGGFISKYGDKSSSVINIRTRDGTRDKLLSGNANLSMAGYGSVLEGRLNGGKGSWIISARNSYIDMIAGAVGLTAVPKYYDLQGKAVYDLSENHKFSLSGIYGNDRINIAGEPQVTNLALAGKSDLVDVYNVSVRQHQYAAGATLNSRWSDDLVSVVTLSKNNYYSNVLVNSEFTQRIYGGDGKVSSTNVLNTRKIYGADDNEGETDLKSEFMWNVDRINQCDLGGAVKFINFKAFESADTDTTRYNFGEYDTTVVVPASNINYDFGFPDYYKGYAYVNDKVSLFDGRLVFNLGLRYDYFSYSRKGNLSPRLSASYSIVPNVLTANMAFGKYYQTPPLPDFGDRYQSGINRHLSSSVADHYVLGVEDIVVEGLKINIEGYYKQYSGLPISENFILFSDQTARSAQIVNAGREDVYGIDFLVQQKLVKDLYGTICLSRMFSKYYDPRIGWEGRTFPSWYDTPYVLTVIAGKRFANLRSSLDDMPFYIKYPSHILPFSNDMEISLRWRYATGMPYTPEVYSTNVQHRVGGSTWTAGSWQTTSNINSARYPDYHRLDIEFSSRYNFRAWSLVILLSVQNIYNRKNVAFYQYNSDGTRETVYQFALLPVAGIEAEF